MKKVSSIVLISLASVCAATSIATMFYLAFDKINNSDDYEAVIINNDESFSRIIDYSAEIVPGGYSVQELEISSRVSMTTSCEIQFFTDEENDYLPLTVTIALGDQKLGESNLDELLSTQAIYQFSVAPNSTDYLKLTYLLDFDYVGPAKTWNFSFSFNADASYV